MARELTGDALAKLLECFDPDPERAGEMYEDERRKLLRHFERKGARSPEKKAHCSSVTRSTTSGVGYIWVVKSAEESEEGRAKHLAF